MFDEWRARALAITAGSLRATSVRRFFVAILGLSLVQMLSGCILTSERPDLALDVPPAYRAGRGRVRAAGARLVARLSLGRAHQAHRRGADRQSRHRRRDRAHHAGRRAEQDRRRAAAAGGRFRRQRDALEAGRAGRARHYCGSRSTPATRSISGARTAPPRAPRRKTPSPPASPRKSSCSPPSSASAPPISRCSRRRTGCGSRARTSPPPTACSR